jgi:hypothetical protein
MILHSKRHAKRILEYAATHLNATSKALVAQDIGSGARVLAIKKSLQLLGS